MTLNDYVSNIIAKLMMAKFKEEEIPVFEFLRRLINAARREIARETRCLQCWNKTVSDKDTGDYRLPDDCLIVLDVMYDGIPLRKKFNREMNYKRRYDTSGVPRYWSKYGGENQSTSFIYLHPKPNQDGVEIKIQTVQLPRELTDKDIVCELQSNIQALVEDAVFATLLQYRGSAPWSLMHAFLTKQIARYINLRVI